MTAPLWEAGHLYQPGDLVQPIQAPAPQSTAITNPGFESGSTDWTLGSGCSVTGAKKFSGTSSVQFTGTAGNVRVLHDSEPVAPGTSITASCMYAQGAADSGHNVGRVVLQWFDLSSVLLREDTGTLINSSSSGWAKSTVTGVAPAGAASVSIGALVFRDRSSTSYVDQFEWNYATQTLQAGLIYQAVQVAAGFSGTSEPAWPSVLGVTVVDNQVTWEAVATSRVTWTAEPILTSGIVEPDWPTTPGEFVSDGTISWECISRRVEDEKCPNSKVVAIMSGKVFAADGDIVKFSATANPLDWSSPEDAGYLPTGLQQSNANDMAVLAPYRSNLAAFNASSFQNWQVDPDPAAMAILDQMDGIGSTWEKAAQAVGNELFFLSALGVRTVGIAAGAENLSAGDVGMPVDSLVQDAMRVTLANGGKAISAYYPGAGQYWLAFPQYPPPGLSLTGAMSDNYVGQSGTYQYTASGGVSPRTLSILVGALPPGASMDAAGLVTFTYTTAGTFTWTVRVTDADGNTLDLADAITVLDPAMATPIPTLKTLLFGINGGGATGIASQNTDNLFDDATIAGSPWARIFTVAYDSDNVDLPPETRTIVYDAPTQGGSVVVDTGWHGATAHQAALTAALTTAGLSAYNGTITAAALVTYNTYDSFLYASVPFVYSAAFAGYSGRAVIYRHGARVDNNVFIEYPDPAQVPVGAVRVDALPGYYLAGGQLYVCGWNATP